MRNWSERLGPLLVPVWQGKLSPGEAYAQVRQEVEMTHVFGPGDAVMILKIIQRLADHDDMNTSSAIMAITRSNLIPRQNIDGGETDVCP